MLLSFTGRPNRIIVIPKLDDLVFVKVNALLAFNVLLKLIFVYCNKLQSWTLEAKVVGCTKKA